MRGFDLLLHPYPGSPANWYALNLTCAFLGTTVIDSVADDEVAQFLNGIFASFSCAQMVKALPEKAKIGGIDLKARVAFALNKLGLR